MKKLSFDTLILNEQVWPMKKKAPHWYKIYIGECLICGKDFSYRERIYGQKPTDLAQIYIYLQSYACSSHF